MLRLLFFLLLILAACSEEEAPIPPYVIPEQKMAEVLAEKHLIDAAVNLHLFKDKMEKKDIEALYLEAYKKYHIRQSQFDSSFTYYKNHPQKLDKVYDLVLTELSERKAEEK